jgi:hypothetical protein
MSIKGASYGIIVALNLPCALIESLNHQTSPNLKDRVCDRIPSLLLCAGYFEGAVQDELTTLP